MTPAIITLAHAVAAYCLAAVVAPALTLPARDTLLLAACIFTLTL